MVCTIENCKNCSIPDALVEGPLPNEIHITVDKADVETFRQKCISLNVKPVLLDLHLKTGGIMKDLMTSSSYFGDLDLALSEAKKLAQNFSDSGYNVVRLKIESAPWHPDAPTLENKKNMSNGSYFESHVAVQIEDEQRPEVNEIAKIYDAHLSRNVFKKSVDNVSIVMLTMRSYSDCREVFAADVEDLAKYLSFKGFKVEKVIHEFCWYDSNLNHDSQWSGLEHNK